MTMAPTKLGPFSDHPIRKQFGRRKFDKQPTQSAAVLIATNGLPIPSSIIKRAVQLSDGEPVAVVTIARIYGSAMGLPNPGLMPTRREMAEQKSIVEQAVRALEAKGTQGWGQVAASRKPIKTIAQAAKARGVHHVLVVRAKQAKWREVVEGDLAKDVGKKLGSDIHVEAVNP
jgi:hypothetical protein